MNDNEVVTVKFLRDALAWLMMLDDDSSPSRIHGLELQQEMDTEYPAEWMAVLYKIGRFENPYAEGYSAFYDDYTFFVDNPYPDDTAAWAEWRDGWQTGRREYMQ